MKLVLCLSVVLLIQFVSSRCPPSDYYPIPSFGENCRYRCHCAADVQCDNVTGECPGPCARGWMGPACQYRNVALNSTNVSQNPNNANQTFVNDGDLTTCSDLIPSDGGNEYFWRLELFRPFYIVGLIIHTPAGAPPSLVQVDTADVMDFTIGKHLCAQSSTVEGGGKTEVMCQKPIVARVLQIVNKGSQHTLHLCELELYGGRHVSFNKNTSQESTLQWGGLTWHSWLAIDGTGTWNDTFGLTCSATNDKSGVNRWWQLNLRTSYRIEDVYVFSRPGYPGQTKNFQMTIGGNNTYQDSNQTSHYVPWTLGLEQPVDGDTLQINKSKILVLCEVIMYAECLPGWCGWECSDVCMCTTLTTGSQRLRAVCPDGCQGRWTGVNGSCDRECSSAHWGSSCYQTCGNCAYNDSCNVTTGTCPRGCSPSWIPGLCNKKCDNGQWGWSCNQTCGNCIFNRACDKVNGACPGGCEAGFESLACVNACNDGWFGLNCSAKCGNCQGGGVNCNHVTGVCSKGCLPGYNNTDATCVHACDDGWFGQNCSAKCGNCQGAGVNCNHVTGVCSKGCLPGFDNSDVKCMQACSPGWFGQNCSVECGNCQRDGYNCDHVSGVCTEGCQPGYNHSDVTCMQSCSPGWFGQNCSAECGNCQGGGANCDHVSGVCAEGCQPGYNHSDVTCMQSVQCPFHTYGRDCIPCGPCKNGLCDPVSGECPFGCNDGYVGKRCETIITNTEVTLGRLTGTGIGVGVGVGVASTLLVVGMIVAVLWAKKRRNHIYEEPIVRMTREQAEESAYASLQDQGNQKVDISGKIQEYENTMFM